jgi:cytochrome c biogenesis protein CcmG/thiol:disulfide interchange protein DsbE
VSRIRRGVVSSLAVLLAAVAAGCTADTVPPAPDEEQASPFAPCTALASPPPSASPAPEQGSADLPDVALPCFTGGAPLQLTDLRGPAVVNVWASWCEPCRTELPMMQHLADRGAGRLTVVGVDTRDGRVAAASFGADHKITMPMLFDPDQQLLGALGRINVPLTIFVDSSGRTFVDPLPLQPAKLAETVRLHTGVTVTP